MNAMTSLRSIGRNVWRGIRFILFGCGGFFAMFFSFVDIFDRLVEQNHTVSLISPFLSLPLLLAGPAMVLYGTGKWGQWGYLWVFLSIPVSIFLISALPADMGGDGFLLIVIIPLIVALATNAGVQSYYKRRVPAAGQMDNQDT